MRRLTPYGPLGLGMMAEALVVVANNKKPSSKACPQQCKIDRMVSMMEKNELSTMAGKGVLVGRLRDVEDKHNKGTP
jgi:hypothetical protein